MSKAVLEVTAGGDVTVFKGGLLHEATLVAETLKHHGIPYYQRTEDFAGIEEAMPALAAPGLGTFFLVRVPAAAAEEALALIRELPVAQDNHPGLWSFNPRPGARRLLVGMSVAGLAMYAAAIIFQAVEYLKY